MEFIIANTDEKIKAEHDKMSGLGSPKYGDMPTGGHNNTAGEDRIIDGIEKIDILKERYRQAVEYMDWFQHSWDKLSNDEKYVLETFYEDNLDVTGNIYEICEHYNIECSSAYNRKNRALDHLQTMLFGKE